MTEAFWSALDSLVAEHEIVIDRPKGTPHPRFSQYIYPMDYGFLKSTASMDGEGIDVYLGSLPGRRLDAILVTVDLLKGDSEIKLLLGLTAEEKQSLLGFHNASQWMKGMLVERGDGR